MGNKKRVRITYYETPDSTRQEPQKHKHVSYSTTANGHLKVSTSFVTTEVPPSTVEDRTETVPDLEEDDDDDEVLDPAYLEHLMAMNVEETFGHQKCRQTAAVGFEVVRDSVLCD